MTLKIVLICLVLLPLVILHYLNKIIEWSASPSWHNDEILDKWSCARERRKKYREENSPTAYDEAYEKMWLEEIGLEAAYLIQCGQSRAQEISYSDYKQWKERSNPDNGYALV